MIEMIKIYLNTKLYYNRLHGYEYNSTVMGCRVFSYNDIIDLGVDSSSMLQNAAKYEMERFQENFLESMSQSGFRICKSIEEGRNAI